MPIAVPSAVKLYAIPLFLFALGLFFQLVVLPRSFPPNHYDVLGVHRHASIEEVGHAYDQISSKWYSELDPPVTAEFIKVRYAFELLTNPLWKRDYDVFGIDEQLHVIKKIEEQFGREHFSKINLPLLNSSLSDSFTDTPDALTYEEFISSVENSKAFLIQVYSAGSPRCSQFSSNWKRIASSLDGVANTGTVELGNSKWAAHLAERKLTRQQYFRNGLPALVSFPPNCKSSGCYERYHGELSVDAIVDWVATDIIGLPRILYYSKESLVPEFIAKSGQHKLKVIFFSKTGDRAAPYLRLAAKDYWSYASFAFVLWKELDLSIWWSTFGVESAPAIVFLKDPGVKPIVYHGSLDSSQFRKIIEDYKQNELPQLRSATSMELGCDARGYSRAGNDTLVWYCVFVAGRPGQELTKMRETILRVRDTLLNGTDSDHASNDDVSIPVLAASALKENRLTFTWLDGEHQQKYCTFYVRSENFQKCCGPRMYEDGINEPQLIMVRFSRNSTENQRKIEKRHSIWGTLKKRAQDNLVQPEGNLASQLTTMYNGSKDVQEIIQWVSNMIKEAESRELPFYVPTPPELVPEDSTSVWSNRSPGKVSFAMGIQKRIKKLVFYLNDFLEDPRIGPSLMLCACIYFGAIWLQNNRTTQSFRESQNGAATRRSSARRDRRARSSRDDRSSASITDEEPKDAYQLLSTDSDTE